MKELKFSYRDYQATFGVAQGIAIKLPKPMICPHCSAYADGIKVQSTLCQTSTADVYSGMVFYRCPNCNKIYAVIYEIDKTRKTATFEALYPSVRLSFSDERLNKLSPRFIDMYNQALLCESSGNIELAAIGYRASLEILVKDYAVVECGIERDVVKNKSLFASIEEYLGNKDLITSADVIRTLGNDYAHYERKYPEHDFEILKEYMEIFIHLVGTKLRLAHPPVSRQDKNPAQPAGFPKVPSTE